MNDLAARLSALPAIYFTIGERAFDLLAEDALCGGIQLLLSLDQVRKAATRESALIIDENGAWEALGEDVDLLSANVILVGRADSVGLWNMARTINPRAVLTVDESSDLGTLARQLRALL